MRMTIAHFIKNKLIKTPKLIACYLVALTLAGIAGCNEENPAEEQIQISPVRLTTDPVTFSGLRSLSAGGQITQAGNQEIVSRGVCWSVNQNPTILDNKQESGTGIGSFEIDIRNFDYNKTYYFRAFAKTNYDSVYYGNQQSLITSITISLQADSSTVSKVYVSGTISEELANVIKFSGVCWDTAPNPIIAPLKNKPLDAGEFGTTLTGLTPNTRYYVRTFMILPTDTLYSASVDIATLPKVHLNDPDAVSREYVILGNNLDANENGDETLTKHGICLSTSPNPTIENTTVQTPDVSTNFHNLIRSLTANTTYYARAYATNASGTSYSEEEITFTTEPTRKITYYLNTEAQPTADQLDAYIRLTQSMNTATGYYNDYTEHKRSVTVNYVPGVPTADANIEGWMRFGSGRSYMNVRTCLHELSHTVGIGTSGGFYSIMVNNIWTGKNGIAAVKELTGNSSATINQYGVHIGPFGLNYDSEGTTPQDFIKHCTLLEAMRKDGL